MQKCSLLILTITLVLIVGACSKASDDDKLITPGTAEQLAGTKWLIGDWTVTFKDETTFLLETEAIEEDFPNGVEGTFSVENGIVEAKALDQTRRGIWNGKDLSVDGASGKKIQ